MKLVVCITRPEKLRAIKEALVAEGITGMTVTDVRGFGRQGGMTELFRGTEFVVDFMHKVKLEIGVPDGKSGDVVRVLTETARTGKVGDGKIFVLELLDAQRIRTGESGEECL